jgi:hypothetical protein
MPTISRFFWISIAMYFSDHGPPHFQTDPAAAMSLAPDITDARVVRHGVLALTFANGLKGEVDVLERIHDVQRRINHQRNLFEDSHDTSWVARQAGSPRLKHSIAEADGTASDGFDPHRALEALGT